MAVTSYFEKQQVRLLMPLRNYIMVPRTQLQDVPPAGDFFAIKASRNGYYINPHTLAARVLPIAAKVLASDADTVTKDEYQELLIVADYFLRSAEPRRSEHGDFLAWPYPIRFDYGLKPGWISGMSQAEIAVVLAAASELISGAEADQYANAARLALRSLEIPVRDGGVLVPVVGGDWYEEYAQDAVEPPRVLNGHVYALLALNMLSRWDDRVVGLYERGLAALERQLPRYDAGTWSYYDRMGTPANNVYQQPLHKRQMKQLFELTGNPIYDRYHRRFALQLWSPFSAAQRLAMKPSRFLAALFVLNQVIVHALFWAMAKGTKRR